MGEAIAPPALALGRRATMVLASWQNLPRLVAGVATALLLVLLLVSFTVQPPASNRVIPPAAIPPAGHAGTGAAPSETILPGGTALQVPGGAFRDVVFELMLGAVLGGSFQSTGSVTLYILDSTSFQQFESQGTVGACAWSAGPASTALLQAHVPAGTWYLVFAAAGSSSSASVVVTSPVEATFPLPALSG
ncbi:MAG TPA: hypothetical protein VGS18_04360 [Thermoplasmata archaeon]|nr:hypothetical protein [Thermoplasmata archaeon]